MTLEKVLIVDTEVVGDKVYNRAFSFSEEGEGRLLGVGVNPNFKNIHEDLFTPQFNEADIFKAENRTKETCCEDIDLNISENVKARKVNARICVNTLKINTQFFITKDSIDKNLSLDSGIFKDKCRLGHGCGCIIY